jgi:hypothetical protein
MERAYATPPAGRYFRMSRPRDLLGMFNTISCDEQAMQDNTDTETNTERGGAIGGESRSVYEAIFREMDDAVFLIDVEQTGEDSLDVRSLDSDGSKSLVSRGKDGEARR